MSQDAQAADARKVRFSSVSVIANQLSRTHPGILLLPLLAAFVLINPVGYVGGGGDEWRFLQAIQCWVAEGPCLARDHWGTRWPAIGPPAIMVGIFGLSRAALQIAPLAYTIAALILFTELVRRHFGHVAGILAGAILIITPLFPWLALRVGCDIPEFAFLLGAALCASIGASNGTGRWCLVAGLLAGLAVQSRETAFVPLAIGAVAFASRFSVRQIAFAVVGFAAPVVIESGFYWWFTGNPFYRFVLAANHTAVPSTALPIALQGKSLPFFNREIIASWTPASGIETHWAISGIVNLLAHRYVVTTFAMSALIAAISWRVTPERKPLLLLALLAAVAAAINIYALALHPLPRMFFPTIAVMCAVAGIMAARALATPRKMLIATILLMAPIPPLIVLATALHLREAERTASSWMRDVDGPVTTDETTFQALAMLPERSRFVLSGESLAVIQLRLPPNNCLRAPPTAYILAESYLIRSRGEQLCLYRRNRRGALPADS